MCHPAVLWVFAAHHPLTDCDRVQYSSTVGDAAVSEHHNPGHGTKDVAHSHCSLSTLPGALRCVVVLLCAGM